MTQDLKRKTSPVLKWVGGKRQLLPELLKRIPESFNRYYEPFIGGGALFFELQPQSAYISDINPELINLYNVIKNNVNELIVELNKHQISKEYFLALRKLDRDIKYNDLSDIQKASRTIYLNKTCFNGLYRVNSKGYFNTPFGKYTNPKIFEKQNLLNCSELLKNTEIKNADFSKIRNFVKKNDFVYFDPPYIPLNKTSNFTSYTQDGFDMDMQITLRNLCDDLDKMGVFFMVSNSDTQAVCDLYKNYSIEKIFASRFINSNAKARGKITEALIKNY